MQGPCGRVGVWLVLGLLAFGCGGGEGGDEPARTPEEAALRAFVAAEFARARDVVDPSDTSSPSTRLFPLHVEVRSERWCLVFDTQGRRIFRPTSVHARMASAIATELGSGLGAWRDTPVSATLVQRARDIAQSALGARTAAGTGATPFALREVLLARSAATPDVRPLYRGRTTILFTTPEHPTSDHTTAVVFDHEEAPLTVETFDLTDAVREAADAYRSGSADGRIRPTHLYDLDLRFGTFFDGTGWRFEKSAYSYEGEDFLWFPRDLFGLADGIWAPTGSCWELPIDMSWYRTHGEYRYWAYTWWYQNAWLGGARGTWSQVSGDWTIPDVAVVHHENLASYAVSGGSTPFANEGVFCDTEHRDFTTSTGNRLEPAFYDELEACHVAAILTHGGPVPLPDDERQPFQIRRNLDHWCPIHLPDQDPLGRGLLRFLLFGTCASMNWFHEAPGVEGGLEGDWMSFHVADGLRMACGHDGGYASADREGWYFFGVYNVGASVTDAWHRSSMRLDATNHPVSVAYDDTLDEALHTLYDGRFEKTRAGAGWIVAVESFVVSVAD